MKQKKSICNKVKIKDVAKKLIVLLFVFAFPLFSIQAQQTIPTTGGNVLGFEGSVSYTVGQIEYTTNTGLTGSVAQGVQQPYEISTGIETEQGKEIKLVFSVYPNPATDFLTLKVENFSGSTLNYTLIDMSGKLIESKKIVDNETKIVMSKLAIATYFLEVYDNSKILKSFKIIKN